MPTYYDEANLNNSCLGLQLGIGTPSTDIPFEFPSVERMVANYQSPRISSDYYLGNNNNKSKEVKKTKGASTNQDISKAGDGEHYIKPEIIREIEKEIDEMLVKLAVPFSALDGKENLWHLTVDSMEDDLRGVVDWEIEVLVQEMENFSPFGGSNQ
ncbi:hypothetical protein PNOK_0023400 [Pyrrhoderma noxium]|uniref:Uncharacterized protein n=1 Tax=Pyrrhoderma noxium TaxID=2282107 RepID=A0A286UU85_9AGAM|nr:hypothetical protein PNOK_0023400 [Pyrrhoderma noxium]